MKVLSTYKILKAKVFNENVDESWIDWAIEMIEAGFESENLYMLAGMTQPYNQFELQGLANRVFEDLKLDYSDSEAVIRNYLYYLISTSIDHPETYLKTLRALRDVCIHSDMDLRYMDFYLLYWAKHDLVTAEVQWYWVGANRANIDRVITDYFQQWLNSHS